MIRWQPRQHDALMLSGQKTLEHQGITLLPGF
jgi:hypothetical protein